MSGARASTYGYQWNHLSVSRRKSCSLGATQHAWGLRMMACPKQACPMQATCMLFSMHRSDYVVPCCHQAKLPQACFTVHG
jgi:hypothetical protein